MNCHYCQKDLELKPASMNRFIIAGCDTCQVLFRFKMDRQLGYPLQVITWDNISIDGKKYRIKAYHDREEQESKFFVYYEQASPVGRWEIILQLNFIPAWT